MTSDRGELPAAHRFQLAVTRAGSKWAVRHGAGYLGLVSSEAEGWAIIRAINEEAQLGAAEPH